MKQDDIEFKERQAKSGKKGGNATKKKYGKAFYARIAKKRWAKKRGDKKAR